MSYKGIIVKNSTSGGNRPIEDYRKDLASAVSDFEDTNGLVVDTSVLSVLGATGHPPTSKKAKAYTHPFPCITSYGDYLFGSVSVPADLDDGKSDYSNLYFLATDSSLVVVFNDPHWVYNPFFGGAVLSLLRRNQQEGIMSVGETLVRILGFTIAALDHSLEALENRYANFQDWIPAGRKHNRRFEVDLDYAYQPIQDLSVEVNSLSAVVERISRMTFAITQTEIGSSLGAIAKNIFSEEDRRTAQGLQLKSEQLVGFQSHLAFEVASLLNRYDHLQETALTVATHRVTVLGALILVPNLVFDFFGQAFDPLPAWLTRSGHLLTLSLTLSYWAVHYLWFRRKRYL